MVFVALASRSQLFAAVLRYFDLPVGSQSGSWEGDAVKEDNSVRGVHSNETGTRVYGDGRVSVRPSACRQRRKTSDRWPEADRQGERSSPRDRAGGVLHGASQAHHVALFAIAHRVRV